MPTVSTGQVETPLATGTQPRRSRWRLAGIGLCALAIPAEGVLAVLKFLDGEYLWSFIFASGLVWAWISLVVSIGGEEFVKRWNQRLWLAAVLIFLVFAHMVVMAILLKRQGDQDRAAEYQARGQLTQPVKEAQ